MHWCKSIDKMDYLTNNRGFSLLLNFLLIVIVLLLMFIIVKLMWFLFSCNSPRKFTAATAAFRMGRWTQSQWTIYLSSIEIHVRERCTRSTKAMITIFKMYKHSLWYKHPLWNTKAIRNAWSAPRNIPNKFTRQPREIIFVHNPLNMYQIRI